MGLKLKTAPTGKVFTAEEIGNYLKIETDDVDAESKLLEDIIDGAMSFFETETNRQLLTATYEFYLDGFFNRGDLYFQPEVDYGYRRHHARVELCERSIILPRPPLQSIVSVKYLNIEAVLTTLDTAVYEADVSSDPGNLRLKYNQVWPEVLSHQDVVTVEFRAGYGEPSQLPFDVKHGLRQLIAHMYFHRMPVITGTIATELPLGLQRVINNFKFRNYI